MRKLYLGLLVLPLLGLVGCSGSSSPHSGGPGVSNAKTGDTANQSKHEAQKETFTLDVPSETITQGDAKDAKITIKRGTDFKEDVALSFENMPKNVTITPDKPVIKASDKDVTVNIKTTADSAIGDFDVKVVGKAKDGPPADSTMKLTIKKK